MPSIMILAETADAGDATVFLTERLTTVQLDDPHFAAQLVERLKWAGADAERAEHEARRGQRFDRTSPRYASSEGPSRR